MYVQHLIGLQGLKIRYLTDVIKKRTTKTHNNTPALAYLTHIIEIFSKAPLFLGKTLSKTSITPLHRPS